MIRTRYTTGGVFESRYGFSRAVKIGDRVLVAGTTAASEHHTGAPGEAVEQVRAILARIDGVLAKFGGSLSDVVSYRCYVVNVPRDAEAIALELGAAFGEIRPAGTLIGSHALILPNMLVEMEFEAILGSSVEIVDL
ncbi:MAG: Rid family hydrolase [Thermomicrobiales bacterium]